jgi:hypothetical protein
VSIPAILACVADVHLANHKVMGGPVEAGFNHRGLLVLSTLDTAYEEATKQGATLMIIAGDLFDTVSPSPQHIAAVQEIIEANDHMETIVLLGNHELQSDREGDHALGPLKPLATVVTKPSRIPTKGLDLWLVPFQSGPAEAWLPRVLEEMARHEHTENIPKLLVLHLGLRDDTTAPWLLNSHDAVPVELVRSLAERYGFQGVLAGNWHEPKRWGGDICQVGTLCPTGFDNPGLGFGTMAFWKDGLVTQVEVPGPRFLNSMEDAWKAFHKGPRGCEFFVRLKLPPEAIPAAEVEFAKLSSACEEQWGPLTRAQLEIIPDTGSALAELRTAVGVTKAAETVDEAVAEYVAQMPLDDEAQRPLVLEAVKGFLGGRK